MKILTIDITGKCNLECRFCYQTSIGELSTEQVMQHINANPDFNSVEIGGGEPFMHPELFEILRKINDSGKTINVSTNATCVSNEFLNLESIIREKITLQVSLQAGNSESYEHVTGSNFFDLVLGNIGRLKEKYQTVISSSIYADNFDTVREILSLAYGFNVPARINLVFPKGRGKDVKLLDGRQVDSLRGLLLAESLQHPGLVESPLIHSANCQVLDQAYGIKKVKKCIADDGFKKYISPLNKVGKCEFLGGKND